jgi:hypothetical protein
MSTLMRYALGALIGALLSTGLFDGPLSLVSAAQYFQPAAITAPPTLTIVDRTAKGDRLRQGSGTTTVIRREDVPSLPAGTKEATDPRLVPASLQDCEPVASPYADPKLGKFAGRCFV